MEAPTVEYKTAMLINNKRIVRNSIFLNTYEPGLKVSQKTYHRRLDFSITFRTDLLTRTF